MGITACSVILHVERGRSPKTSVLRSRTSRTPPSHHPGLGPAPGLPGSARGAGSKVRHGRSSGGQGEAGTGPARAWQRVPGRLGGAGTRGVQGAPVARCWGRPPRRAVRQGPGLGQPRGRRGATLSLRPPPSFPPARPAAEISSRGNYADPSRGSSPRPRSPPPPLRWGAGARPRRRGGAGSLDREVAGGRGDVVLPCDAALRPAIPSAPRARARALSRGTSCCCPATRAHPPPRNPRSIPASAGRWSLPGSSYVSFAAPSWSAPERSRRSPTSPKVLDECQNQRACHLLVNSRVFGPDLCPGSSKYLLVSFKCQPNELKNKTVCEDHELKLHCHESKFLNIYSATYGRRTQERDVCTSEAGRLPPFDCLSYSALHVLSRRCYGKQRCKVLVNNHHFGSPCLPGVKKYLSVFYACVPKNILTAIDPSVANIKPSVKQKDGDYGVDLDPREPRILRKDGVIVSHSLAAFAYIRGVCAVRCGWSQRCCPGLGLCITHLPGRTPVSMGLGPGEDRQLLRALTCSLLYSPPRESRPAVRVQRLHRSGAHAVCVGHQSVLHQGPPGAAAGQGAPGARKRQGRGGQPGRGGGGGLL
ncbi:protein eva-1 homolog C isoform X4 [Cervus elaphus]|uniref:protein eva-1 homolog C isoform X4 n=1 Tax=Cervus elaphus TaxID=9860 RepID=UPI001CC2CAD1|nr:protein eva-1 homolog C isoform X4 [Cervus elaphus]